MILQMLACENSREERTGKKDTVVCTWQPFRSTPPFLSPSPELLGGPFTCEGKEGIEGRNQVASPYSLSGKEVPLTAEERARELRAYL